MTPSRGTRRLSEPNRSREPTPAPEVGQEMSTSNVLPLNYSPPASASAPPTHHLPDILDNDFQSSNSPERTPNSPDYPTACPPLTDHFPIYVETLTGVTFEMQVLPTETVLAIKLKLEAAEGIAANKQHLLWQNYELRDDFTLDEYNIGFGALLRLVLGLKVGPLEAVNWQQSSNFNYFGHSASSSGGGGRERKDGQCSGHGEYDSSRPLTVLFFRDGDNIKILTISTSTAVSTAMATATSTRDPFDNDPSIGENQQNLSRPISRRWSGRRRENEAMKAKVKDLQARLEKLSIKKNSTRLPVIKTRSKATAAHEQRLNSSIATKGESVNLPPLVAAKVKNSAPTIKKSVNELKQTKKGHDAELKPKFNQFNEVNKTSQFTKSMSRVRSSSLGGESMTVRPGKETVLSHQMSFKLGTATTVTTSETSSVGCVAATVKLEQRPRTSPMVGNIVELRTFPSIELLLAENALKKTPSIVGLPRRKQNKSTASKLMSKVSTSSKGHASNVRKRTPRRIKCAECRKKLPLAARFECRCEQMFCAQHRYSEAHQCNYNYREEGKRLISLANPVVRAAKLPKI